MTEQHSHNYWKTSAGVLECRCGKSMRGTVATYEPNTDLSPKEAAMVARFGFDQPEPDYDLLRKQDIEDRLAEDDNL